MKEEEKEKKAWTLKDYALAIGIVAGLFAIAEGVEKRFIKKKDDATKVVITIPKEPCAGNFTVIATKDSYTYECEIIDKDIPVVIKQVKK
tara:strand:- start:2433 stop:2702 length:270 start_codon:yes stop_codon:yes gene_type:complete